MAASKKVIENSNRLRYVRALERFHKSIIAYLSSSENLTKEGYEKKIKNSLKLLNRVEEIALYKGELQDMQKHVKKMIGFLNADDAIDDIKSELLYGANQLEKNKNSRRYKKDKHTNNNFDEWE